MTARPRIQQTDDGNLILDIKVVPGASQDQIIGTLGESLKIRVSAAPEGGRANVAVCGLLARALDIPRRHVTVVSGHTQPHKRIAIRGVDARTVVSRLL